MSFEVVFLFVCDGTVVALEQPFLGVSSLNVPEQFTFSLISSSTDFADKVEFFFVGCVNVMSKVISSLK